MVSLTCDNGGPEVFFGGRGMGNELLHYKIHSFMMRYPFYI